jgi:hypothetical protein
MAGWGEGGERGGDRMKFIFLFEHSGYAAEPFTRRGHETIIVDLLNTKDNLKATRTLNWNILDKENDLIELAQDAAFIFGMPPCTDLAGSGAGHFRAKYEKNKNFLNEADYLFMSTFRIANGKIPAANENPVGLMSPRWRKPDYYFHPYQYGGYLPEDDKHPEFPQYIKPRDAYPKKTCLWTENGFRIPQSKPVYCSPGYSTQHMKLGGKSAKTKSIRSMSPRGFFEALAQEYCK